MRNALAALYIASVPALAIVAVLIWRLRCEGFGCMGVGVAWLAWVGMFMLALVMGGVIRSCASLGPRLRRLTRWAVWAQVALGAGWLAVWMSRNVA